IHANAPTRAQLTPNVLVDSWYAPPRPPTKNWHVTPPTSTFRSTRTSATSSTGTMSHWPTTNFIPSVTSTARLSTTEHKPVYSSTQQATSTGSHSTSTAAAIYPSPTTTTSYPPTSSLPPLPTPTASTLSNPTVASSAVSMMNLYVSSTSMT